MASRAMKDLLHHVQRDADFLELMRVAPERAIAGYKVTRAERDALLRGGPELEAYLRPRGGAKGAGVMAPASLQIMPPGLAPASLHIQPPPGLAPAQLPPDFRARVAPTDAMRQLAATVRASSGDARRDAIVALLKTLDGRSAAAAPQSWQVGKAPRAARRRGRPAESAFDIYIVGLGMVGVTQITREVEGALRASREIFYLDQDFGVGDYLAELGGRATDLLPLSYRERENRLDAYDRMATYVLDAALDHPPVTFALYGHPLVYVYPAQQILSVSPLLERRVKVLPGVSSLDGLFVDLELDPGTQGLQMYEATDLILRDRPLQPDVPCVILQVGAVETALYSNARSLPARFERLQRHLLKFYPPDHQAFVVVTSTFPLLKGHADPIPLGELAQRLAERSYGDTLYIPPTGVRPIADRAVLADMASSDHLKAITSGTAISS